MDELELFDNIDEALSGVVIALGGAKKVGHLLRPDLPIDQAATYVRDRINTDRRELFSPQQVVFLFKKARDAGYHAGMRWFAGECGYTGTRPAELDEQKADLQRQFIAAIGAAERLGKQLQRLEAGQ